MHSIKPGRGPSLMEGIGSLVAIMFGIFWTMKAAELGAPPFFVLFGVMFILIGVATAVYHFYNATAKDRISTFDITGPGEESDPVERMLGKEADAKPAIPLRRYPGDFCPFCGAEVEGNFDYCPKCGKDI